MNRTDREKLHALKITESSLIAALDVLKLFDEDRPSVAVDVSKVSGRAVSVLERLGVIETAEAPEGEKHIAVLRRSTR